MKGKTFAQRFELQKVDLTRSKQEAEIGVLKDHMLDRKHAREERKKQLQFNSSKMELKALAQAKQMSIETTKVHLETQKMKIEELKVIRDCLVNWNNVIISPQVNPQWVKNSLLNERNQMFTCFGKILSQLKFHEEKHLIPANDHLHEHNHSGNHLSPMKETQFF